LVIVDEDADVMDSLKKRGQPDRSKISITEAHEVRYWTKHLDVSQEELLRAVEKVGNAAAAVRKELGKQPATSRDDVAS
jgi:hypothetical protein